MASISSPVRRHAVVDHRIAVQHRAALRARTPRRRAAPARSARCACSCRSSSARCRRGRPGRASAISSQLQRERAEAAARLRQAAPLRPPPGAAPSASCLCCGSAWCSATASSKSTSRAGGPAREVLAAHRGEHVVRECAAATAAALQRQARTVRSSPISSFNGARCARPERQRLPRLDLAQQAAGVEQVLAGRAAAAARAAAARTARADRRARSPGSPPDRGLCTSAPPVPITTPTSDRSLPRCTIAGPLHGVHGLDGAGVALHRQPHGGAGQRPVERALLGVCRQRARRRAPSSSISARTRAAARPLSAAMRADARRFDDRRGVVAHAEVALDRALHPRLRQALRNDAGRARLAGGRPSARRWWRRRDRRPAARRGPPRPAQPSASSRAPSITAAGVGISTWSNIACARSMPLACTMRSMNTSRIAARAGSMLSTLNSGITFSVTISVPAGEALAARRPARSRLPASTIGQASAASPERVGVVQDDLAVAAVGAAGQQQDVRRELLDPARRRPRSGDRRRSRPAARRRRAPPGAPPRRSARAPGRR